MSSRNKLDLYIEEKQKEKIRLKVIELKNAGNSYELIENNLISQKFSKKLINKIMFKQGVVKKTIIKESTLKKEEVSKKKNIVKNEIILKKEKNEKSKKNNHKFYFQEKKRVQVVIGMIFLFIFALVVFSYLNQPEKGNGTCPLVKLDDMNKISSLYFEQNDEINFIEIDEMIGAYLGKSDCDLIDSKTVSKLRNIDII